MAPIQPNPRTWTFRFKHNRTTIFLHVDPLQKLSVVKSELLSALRQTYPSGDLNGHAIPHTADEVLLARPTDVHDLTLGWENLEPEEDDFDRAIMDGEAARSVGKGKARAGTGNIKSGKDAQIRDSVMGAGLKDGSVLAFKFRETNNTNDGEDRAADDDFLVKEKAEEWDVAIPSLEETYGEGDQDASLGLPRTDHEGLEEG